MSLPINQIINGDCLEVMKTFPDNSIDLVVTDPPYGISFMGKDWDSFNEVVNPQGAYEKMKGFNKLPRNKPIAMREFFTPIWKETLRVLKSGGFAFILCTPRQDCLCNQIISLQDAGFNTNFTSIYWTYASGFPKASNISKMVDKRLGVEPIKTSLKEYDSPDFSDEQFVKQGSMMQTHQTSPRIQTYNTTPSSPQDKALDGSFCGFQPKPAVEIIIVAMKPLSEKNYVEQALKNGKGVTWLNDCRIPYKSEEDKESSRFGIQTDIKGGNYGNNRPSNGNILAKNVLSSSNGRFPANLLVSDDVLNDGSNHKSGKIEPHHIAKMDFSKTATKWGLKKTGGFNSGGDEGSFSRYFDLDVWWRERIKLLPPKVRKTFPFLIVPKASNSEKDKGCESLDNETYLDESRQDKEAVGCNNPRNRSGKPKIGNTHPTVKPLKLLSYLVVLGSRENDVVLDPFLGSGTTAIACKQLNRKFIGIELSKEYYEIACKRLEPYMNQTNLSIFLDPK